MRPRQPRLTDPTYTPPRGGWGLVGPSRWDGQPRLSHWVSQSRATEHGRATALPHLEGLSPSRMLAQAPVSKDGGWPGHWRAAMHTLPAHPITHLIAMAIPKQGGSPTGGGEARLCPRDPRSAPRCTHSPHNRPNPRRSPKGNRAAL